jgi:hypothetical protein
VKPGRSLTVCTGDVYEVSRAVPKAVATMLATMVALHGTPEIPMASPGADGEAPYLIA